MENNYVIIMAGGIGSRFWPLSNKAFPKQFQDILGTGQTMIRQTAERFRGICAEQNLYVVTNRDYIPLVKEQLPFLSDEQILGEPEGKNTAPCIAYAAYKIRSKNPRANLVVSPADHVVMNPEEFQRKIKQALAYTALNNALVTLGIRPHRPDTGYGYIRFRQTDEAVKPVEKFTEKPDRATAESFLKSGNYLWNSGIFIWNADAIVGAFEKHLPAMHNLFRSDQWYTENEDELVEDIYAKSEAISIDYGILERAADVRVIESDFGWSDLGTWNSLYDISDKDENRNVLHGAIRTYDSSGNIVKTPQGKTVVVQGLKDYIVVDTKDALMICDRSREQMVRQFVRDINQAGD